LLCTKRGGNHNAHKFYRAENAIEL